LVDRLVSDDSFAAEADALAERLATGPTRAYAGAKEQINARMYSGLEEQLELEASLQHDAAGSGDFREGVQAFLDKRPATFEGE
jgi:2-(1,2-epoxy-1,2-dihydrophenyl)acetyl-CoA isomerase